MNDGEVESLFECRKAFDDLWGLQVEIDELRPVVDDLVDDGLAARMGKGFRLATGLLTELDSKAREWQETEDRATRDWELAVRQAMPTVSEETMQLLGDDLRQWLHFIISHHGAEAALMLYRHPHGGWEAVGRGDRRVVQLVAGPM